MSEPQPKSPVLVAVIVAGWCLAVIVLALAGFAKAAMQSIWFQ